MLQRSEGQMAWIPQDDPSTLKPHPLLLPDPSSGSPNPTGRAECPMKTSVGVPNQVKKSWCLITSPQGMWHSRMEDGGPPYP